MRQDTFTTGAVAQFDESTSPTTAAPTTAEFFGGAVKCGSQITYDWPNGRLTSRYPDF